MASLFAPSVDLSTIEALKLGDKKAQHEIYEKLSSAVFTMVSRILEDRQLAEEVTQDTFVDVINRAGTLSNPKAFHGWVRSIALNHCFMRLRSPWMRRRENIENHTDRLELAEDIQVTERVVDINAALKKLSPLDRMIVWMHCIEGYTHDEIGRVFSKTASFSKNRLAIAYRKLESNSEERRRSHRKHLDEGLEPSTV